METEFTEIVFSSILFVDSKRIFWKWNKIKSQSEKRQVQRDIDDLTVINILENNGNSRRRRNKQKDKYLFGCEDWNYCIEGYDSDDRKIRVIISFDSDQMLIITVMRIQVRR